MEKLLDFKRNDAFGFGPVKMVCGHYKNPASMWKYKIEDWKTH